MWRFQPKLLFRVTEFLMCISLILTALLLVNITVAADADVTTCSGAKCDQNINEKLVDIIQKSINITIDPCEDFYNYACGNWKETSKSSLSAFDDQENSFAKIYVNIFEKWQKDLHEGTEQLKLNAAYEKALNYYSSCIEEKEFKLNEIPKIFDPAPQQKWPIYWNRTSLPWKFENFVWWKVLAKLQSYDLTNLLLTVQVQMQNRSKYAIVIGHYDDYDNTYNEINDIRQAITFAMGEYSSLQEKILRRKLITFEKQLIESIRNTSVGKMESIQPLEEEETKKTTDKNESSTKSYKEMKRAKRSKETQKDLNDILSDESSEEDDPWTFIAVSELQSELLNIDWQKFYSKTPPLECGNISESSEQRAEKNKEQWIHITLNDLKSKLLAINWQKYYERNADKIEISDEINEEIKAEQDAQSAVEDSTNKEEPTQKVEENSTNKQKNKLNWKESALENYFSLNELQFELPGIDWQEYFNILLSNSDIKLPNDKIYKISAHKMDEIRQLIAFLNRSSKETVALYMLVQFIHHVQLQWPLENSRNYCANSLNGLMPVALNHFYEDNYYSNIRDESDGVIYSVFHTLKIKFNDLIENNNMNLTRDEIEYLQLKNNKMELIIGNVPANKTVEFLVDYYAIVNITNSTSFYHNYLELLRHKQLLQYRILTTYYNSAQNVFESFDPVMGLDASASPYYLSNRNLIVLPFAYLRLPLYHHKLHAIFQFAELGFALGHEIMHGFDKNGLWYDADGNFNNIGWDISRKEIFIKKFECFQLESIDSLNERIADIAGVHLVMEAYFNVLNSNFNEEKLNDYSISLTNRQLFLIKFAQYFCEKPEEDDDDDEVEIKNSFDLSHDIAKDRVQYIIANTLEFAKEFECDINKRLEFDKTCQLW